MSEFSRTTGVTGRRRVLYGVFVGEFTFLLLTERLKTHLQGCLTVALFFASSFARLVKAGSLPPNEKTGGEDRLSGFRSQSLIVFCTINPCYRSFCLAAGMYDLNDNGKLSDE